MAKAYALVNATSSAWTSWHKVRSFLPVKRPLLLLRMLHDDSRQPNAAKGSRSGGVIKSIPQHMRTARLSSACSIDDH